MFYQENLNVFVITTKNSEKDLYDPENVFYKDFKEVCELQLKIENKSNEIKEDYLIKKGYLIKEDYLINSNYLFHTNRIEIQLWENAKVKNENTLEMSGKYLKTLKKYRLNDDREIIEDMNEN